MGALARLEFKLKSGLARVPILQNLLNHAAAAERVRAVLVVVELGVGREAQAVEHRGGEVFGPDARRFFRDGLYVTGSPTAHLFRADLVRARQPFYTPASDPFSDTDACLWAFARSDFAFAHQVLTFTRRSNVSITTRRRAYTNTLLLVRYLNLLRHGAQFFSADELRSCHRSTSRAPASHSP